MALATDDSREVRKMRKHARQEKLMRKKGAQEITQKLTTHVS